MRFLTMNIFGLHGVWDVRRRALVAGLRDLAPDVMTLQETVVTDAYDQVADVLGRGHHVFHQAGRSGDGVGASIASRWPLEVIHQADLHVSEGGDPTGWIGSLAIVRIDLPPPVGPVLVAHHKPTWQSDLERVRELQAVRSARVIEEVCAGAHAHVLLAGDFDATPDSASVRFWTGRQSLEGMSVCYQDTWEALHPGEPGHTFTPGNDLVSEAWRPRPGRRIDYIMVRCGAKGAGLDITACEPALAAPIEGAWASDHFGLVADLSPRA